MKGQKDHQLLIETKLLDVDKKAEYPGIILDFFLVA